jgi:quercetin dioxygenase-like cupin family protein
LLAIKRIIPKPAPVASVLAGAVLQKARFELQNQRMKPDAELSAVLVETGAGQVLHAFGEKVIIHLGGKETGGALSLWTEITPPGGGPPPHYHENETETFLVQEGHFAFYRDGQWQNLGPGGIAFIPRNVVHTFKNTGQTPGRMLISTSPAGFEVFFARCAEEFKKQDGADMDRIVQISAEHGIHFVNG